MFVLLIQLDVMHFIGLLKLFQVLKSAYKKSIQVHSYKKMHPYFSEADWEAWTCPCLDHVCKYIS